MSARNVARGSIVAALTGLLVVSTVGAAVAAPGGSKGGGKVEDVIELPDGFFPEGIAIGPRSTAYVGSLVDGDIYAARDAQIGAARAPCRRLRNGERQHLPRFGALGPPGKYRRIVEARCAVRSRYSKNS